MQPTKILSFFFELGMLSRVKREGWRLLGVLQPESVAEHSLRAAQIGFFLAEMENHHNPHEIVSILVFHDIGECRIGDLHKLAARYVEADEKRAVEEQLAELGDIGTKINDLWDQIESRSTPAGIIAKDADLLELAVHAKELIDQGFSGAKEWLDTATRLVKTDSAKTLIAQLPDAPSAGWWLGLKKITE